MANDSFSLTITSKVIELCQQSEGFTLSNKQFEAIAKGLDTAPWAINGCIQSLGYVDGKDEQQLQQIVINSSQRRIILTERADVKVDKSIFKVTNLKSFERILKNAADFGHRVCIIIESNKLIWCSLQPFQCCPSKNGIEAIFSKDPPPPPPPPPPF